MVSSEDSSSPAKSHRSTVDAPLCVDLDGTLLNTDLLWESFASTLRSNPFIILLAPLWLLLSGKSGLKHQLAKRAGLLSSLPFNPAVLALVNAEHLRGREIYLVTASDRELAHKVTSHLGVFTDVYGSTRLLNLKGARKADLLITRFGKQGFEYVGDSRADLPVWSAASAAYIVGSKILPKDVQGNCEVRQVLPRNEPTARLWLKAFRVHHWAKNLVFFLPLLLSHKFHWLPFLLTLEGAFWFGLCSSGIYILNDLLDLASDRHHPWKNNRPFARGDLPIGAGFLISLGLIATAIGCSVAILGFRFGAVVGAYALLALCYSLALKKVAIVDVFVLAGFYSVRIWAGALTTNTVLSQWFLAFSLFFFLSLAMAKRYSELLHARDLLESGRSGRGYLAVDRELLLAVGVASSFSAVVIFALYVHSAEVQALYSRPEPLLWLAPLLLFWLIRIWLKATRGELDEDPVTLAVKDPASYLTAILAMSIIGFCLVRLA